MACSKNILAYSKLLSKTSAKRRSLRSLFFCLLYLSRSRSSLVHFLIHSLEFVGYKAVVWRRLANAAALSLYNAFNCLWISSILLLSPFISLSEILSDGETLSFSTLFLRDFTLSSHALALCVTWSTHCFHDFWSPCLFVFLSSIRRVSHWLSLWRYSQYVEKSNRLLIISSVLFFRNDSKACWVSVVVQTSSWKVVISFCVSAIAFHFSLASFFLSLVSIFLCFFSSFFSALISLFSALLSFLACLLSKLMATHIKNKLY